MTRQDRSATDPTPCAIPLSVETFRELQRGYGDSFYLVDLDAFKANYHEFLDAFRSRYPNTNIAYSYKTNYTPELCRMVDSWGGMAEVVSRMEYDLATRIGVDPRRIIFNGPSKQKEDVEHSLTGGSILHVDSPYQVPLVEEVARRHRDKALTVGIRLTFDLGIGIPSRFGFDADSSKPQEVVRALRVLENVNVAGLHCHFTTKSRTTEIYGRIAERMLRAADVLFDDGLPAYLDVGGGYYSKMNESLRVQFGAPIPSYDDYAEAIAARFAERYDSAEPPELIVEPGMAITADIMRFAAQVIDVQTLAGRNLVLVSGSIQNLQPTPSERNLPVTVFPAGQQGVARLTGKADIVGYTCMEHDVLHHGFGGSIGVGDWVVFENVGAYTNVLKPPFISTCPAMLGWRSSTGAFEVLKHKETLDDVFRTYGL